MNRASHTPQHIALTGILALASACGAMNPKAPESVATNSQGAEVMTEYLRGLNTKLLTLLKTANDAGQCSKIPMDGNRTRLLCTGMGGQTFGLTAQSSEQIGCALSNASDQSLFPNTSLFFTPDSLPKNTRIQIGSALCENNICLGKIASDDDMMKVLGTAIDICDTLSTVLQ